MIDIKKIAILGGGGAMGSQSGVIFARAGVRCLFFDLTIEKAQAGIDTAVKQSRSDVLKKYIEPRSFADMEKDIPECDWIFEAVAENLDLKRSYFIKTDKIRKKGSVVSTVSSSLSIKGLAEGRSDDFKKHFLGVHFFNPPGNLQANELTFHPMNTPDLKHSVREFCKQSLNRINIVTLDSPGFAGNRIGFQFLNEAVIYAEKYGIEKIDYLLGAYTGRTMPPLATLDHVGLDIHRAIMNNINDKVRDERSDTHKIQAFFEKMIEIGIIGRKGSGSSGFYQREKNKPVQVIDPRTLKYNKVEGITFDFVERAKQLIYDGKYADAADVIKNTVSVEADIVRHFILGYISYSFFRIGEVTPEEEGIHGIDRVMAYGFSWVPPSGWVDFLGVPGATIRLMEKAGLPVPDKLRSLPDSRPDRFNRYCRVPEITKYILAV
jgi:3-hydroxyacyl-CoA dehydrogenase